MKFLHLNKLRVADPGKQLVLILAATTFVATFLVGLRIYLTGNLSFIFMVWNLFLAWIPFSISFYMRSTATRQRKWYLNLMLFVMWLAFFPNGPYILTDLVHLQPRHNIGFWYDMMILLFFCFNSLFLAFASMIHMKRIIDFFLKKWMSHLLILVIFSLTSLGIYIGRFQRYNSWDIITNPVNLIKDVSGLFLNADNDFRFVYMVFFLALFLIINYFTVIFLFNDMHQKETSHESKK